MQRFFNESIAQQTQKIPYQTLHICHNSRELNNQLKYCDTNKIFSILFQIRDWN